MQYRYATWMRIVQEMKAGTLVQKLFGFGMGADMEMDSLYIKIYYSMGWTGIVLTVLFLLSIVRKVTRMDDRKTFFLLISQKTLWTNLGKTVDNLWRKG